MQIQFKLQGPAYIFVELSQRLLLDKHLKNMMMKLNVSHGSFPETIEVSRLCFVYYPEAAIQQMRCLKHQAGVFKVACYCDLSFVI